MHQSAAAAPAHADAVRLVDDEDRAVGAADAVQVDEGGEVAVGAEHGVGERRGHGPRRGRRSARVDGGDVAVRR